MCRPSGRHRMILRERPSMSTISAGSVLPGGLCRTNGRPSVRNGCRGSGARQADAAARLSCTARARAPPLPIVLHDGERAGVRGRCERRWCGRSLRGGGPPQRPHALLPLTLALSPRREERRGERGRATPPPRRTSRSAADLTPSAPRLTSHRPRKRAPSPHRSSRWGEGRGEGQIRAQMVRPIVPQRSPVPTPSHVPAPRPSPLPTA